MGAAYRFGDVFVTMICGFHEPPGDWGNLGQAERLNAGSIVMHLIYNDRAILFGGDAVGRQWVAFGCLPGRQFAYLRFWGAK